MAGLGQRRRAAAGEEQEQLREAHGRLGAGGALGDWNSSSSGREGGEGAGQLGQQPSRAMILRRRRMQQTAAGMDDSDEIEAEVVLHATGPDSADWDGADGAAIDAATAAGQGGGGGGGAHELYGITVSDTGADVSGHCLLRDRRFPGRSLSGQLSGMPLRYQAPGHRKIPYYYLPAAPGAIRPPAYRFTHTHTQNVLSAGASVNHPRDENPWANQWLPLFTYRDGQGQTQQQAVWVTARGSSSATWRNLVEDQVRERGGVDTSPN
eukprot:XP_001697679.1 predicted protein [Chlamydomonas reinhardtii]